MCVPFSGKQGRLLMRMNDRHKTIESGLRCPICVCWVSTRQEKWCSYIIESTLAKRRVDTKVQSAVFGFQVSCGSLQDSYIIEPTVAKRRIECRHSVWVSGVLWLCWVSTLCPPIGPVQLCPARNTLL